MDEHYKVSMIIPTDPNGSDECIRDVCHAFADEFGGYSCYEGRGGWLNNDGELIEEPHVRVESVTDSNREFVERLATSTANLVRTALDQDAVMVEIEETTVEFVTSANRKD